MIVSIAQVVLVVGMDSTEQQPLHAEHQGASSCAVPLLVVLSVIVSIAQIVLVVGMDFTQQQPLRANGAGPGSPASSSSSCTISGARFIHFAG